jgi:hypothetical protein
VLAIQISPSDGSMKTACANAVGGTPNRVHK